MIYIIRHMEKERHEPVSEGQSYAEYTRTIGLTPAGAARAIRVADFFAHRAHVRRIVSSDFRRALQTAEIIGKTLNVHVEVDDRLGERVLCNDGTTTEQIDRYNRKSLADWSWRAPGGESMDEVSDRLSAAITMLDDDPTGDTLLISHSRAIQAYAGRTDNDNALHYTSSDPSIIIPYGMILGISNNIVRTVSRVE